MPEPVDPVADWLATRGGKVAVQVAAYVPATDEDDETWAAPVGAWGMRTGRRVERAAVEGGEVPAVSCRWALAWSGDRPPLNSTVTDGEDVWLVGGYARDPLDGVILCECVLIG